MSQSTVGGLELKYANAERLSRRGGCTAGPLCDSMHAIMRSTPSRIPTQAPHVQRRGAAALAVGPRDRLNHLSPCQSELLLAVRHSLLVDGAVVPVSLREQLQERILLSRIDVSQERGFRWQSGGDERTP